MQQEFDRPQIPLQQRKEAQAREGAKAMADYRRGQDKVLERMVELRRMRREHGQATDASRTSET